MSSKNQTPEKSWKKLFLEAKKLTGKLGVIVYRRTKLLLEVFDDAEFRAEIGARDDFKAADWLDAEFKGVALPFLELRKLLERFPEEKDWKDGDFVKMHEALAVDDTPQEKPPAQRFHVTKAEHEEVQYDREHWKTRATYLQKQVAELEEERAEHRQTIANLQGRIKELERLLDSSRVPA